MIIQEPLPIYLYPSLVYSDVHLHDYAVKHNVAAILATVPTKCLKIPGPDRMSLAGLTMFNVEEFKYKDACCIWDSNTLCVYVGVYECL